MLYKTMVLSLLESYPKLHERLRLSRMLHQEVERYASDLRTAYLECRRVYPPDTATELAMTEIETRIAQEAARCGT